MAKTRDNNTMNPYGAFKFRVEFGDVDGNKILAGFSDVSGLGTELNYAEYREGTDKPNTVRKIPNTFKVDEVTFKRGLIGSTDIFAWIKAVNEGRYQPRPVTIVVLDEAGEEALKIELKNAQPKKWTGPTLAGKGGGDVATEEMKVVHEGLEYR